MSKQYKLTGTITLPIEMIVECDTEIAPSEFAEKILLEADNVLDDSPLKGMMQLNIDGKIAEVGAIEFNDIEEQNPLFI
ncbi:hypothetical protein QUF74_05570 [Candidatus Halobeggiatoa sp. HSG11]|nr:hypothetical protein [Candidatus Halobeggiatoa sp. HSG11]